jgi:Gpi18-like mannosyltransferase
MKLSLPEDKFPYIFSLFYFVFNSFFISRVLALTHDSIYYYDEILTRPHNLFPHHLLFTPFMSIFSGIIKLSGINSDLIAISLVNTIAGSVIVIIIYKILRNNFNYTKTASRIAVLICSFSFSFWFYNLNIETYQLPMVFIFSAIYFLTREPRRNTDLYIAAMLGGIGVLFHQLHGLFGLVAVIFLIISGVKKNLKANYFLCNNF